MSFENIKVKQFCTTRIWDVENWSNLLLINDINFYITVRRNSDGNKVLVYTFEVYITEEFVKTLIEDYGFPHPKK